MALCDHTVFLLGDGTVKACGRNDCGQLGIGNTDKQVSLVEALVTDVNQVMCGSCYTVFLS